MSNNKDWGMSYDRYWELQENATRRKPMYKCWYCERTIYEGDAYYALNDKTYCPDCVDANFKDYA